mgnify:CR=1 FL=1
MFRNGSELRVFAWANIVYKPTLCLFDYSIRHIDPTAKYDGLPRRFLVFNFPYFLGFHFFLLKKKRNGKKKLENKKKLMKNQIKSLIKNNKLNTRSKIGKNEN